MPGPAWMDGDIIRSVDHECSSGTDKSDGSACDRGPLVALALSLDTMTWSVPVKIDTHGNVLSSDGAAENGTTLIMPDHAHCRCRFG